MNVRTSVVGAVVALAAVTALIVSSAGSAKPEQSDFKMAIVTDIGELNDRSFNQLANEGRKAVGKELGIQTRVYETTSEAQRVPNLLAAARAGYNLIFGVGFLNYSALNTVAPKFPDITVRGHRRAVRAVRQEAEERRAVRSPPSRRVATSSATSPGCRSRSRAASRSSAPSVRTTCPRSCSYISGYIQGAKKANPKIKVLVELRERPDLRRPGEVQGDRARPDPEGNAGDLPGRRWLRSGRSLGREGRGTSGASASTPTSSTSART